MASSDSSDTPVRPQRRLLVDDDDEDEEDEDTPAPQLRRQPPSGGSSTGTPVRPRRTAAGEDGSSSSSGSDPRVRRHASVASTSTAVSAGLAAARSRGSGRRSGGRRLPATDGVVRGGTDFFDTPQRSSVAAAAGVDTTPAHPTAAGGLRSVSAVETTPAQQHEAASGVEAEAVAARSVSAVETTPAHEAASAGVAAAGGLRRVSDGAAPSGSPAATVGGWRRRSEAGDDGVSGVAPEAAAAGGLTAQPAAGTAATHEAGDDGVSGVAPEVVGLTAQPAAGTGGTHEAGDDGVSGVAPEVVGLTAQPGCDEATPARPRRLSVAERAAAAAAKFSTPRAGGHRRRLPAMQAVFAAERLQERSTTQLARKAFRALRATSLPRYARRTAAVSLMSRYYGTWYGHLQIRMREALARERGRVTSGQAKRERLFGLCLPGSEEVRATLLPGSAADGGGGGWEEIVSAHRAQTRLMAEADVSGELHPRARFEEPSEVEDLCIAGSMQRGLPVQLSTAGAPRRPRADDGGVVTRTVGGGGHPDWSWEGALDRSEKPLATQLDDLLDTCDPDACAEDGGVDDREDMWAGRCQSLKVALEKAEQARDDAVAELEAKEHRLSAALQVERDGRSFLSGQLKEVAAEAARLSESHSNALRSLSEERRVRVTCEEAAAAMMERADRAERALASAVARTEREVEARATDEIDRLKLRLSAVSGRAAELDVWYKRSKAVGARWLRRCAAGERRERAKMAALDAASPLSVMSYDVDLAHASHTADRLHTARNEEAARAEIDSRRRVDAEWAEGLRRLAVWVQLDRHLRQDLAAAKAVARRYAADGAAMAAACEGLEAECRDRLSDEEDRARLLVVVWAQDLHSVMRKLLVQRETLESHVRASEAAVAFAQTETRQLQKRVSALIQDRDGDREQCDIAWRGRLDEAESVWRKELERRSARYEGDISAKEREWEIERARLRADLFEADAKASRGAADIGRLTALERRLRQAEQDEAQRREDCARLKVLEQRMSDAERDSECKLRDTVERERAAAAVLQGEVSALRAELAEAQLKSAGLEVKVEAAIREERRRRMQSSSQEERAAAHHRAEMREVQKILQKVRSENEELEEELSVVRRKVHAMRDASVQLRSHVHSPRESTIPPSPPLYIVLQKGVPFDELRIASAFADSLGLPLSAVEILGSEQSPPRVCVRFSSTSQPPADLTIRTVESWAESGVPPALRGAAVALEVASGVVAAVVAERESAEARVREAEERAAAAEDVVAADARTRELREHESELRRAVGVASTELIKVEAALKDLRSEQAAAEAAARAEIVNARLAVRVCAEARADLEGVLKQAAEAGASEYSPQVCRRVVTLERSGRRTLVSAEADSRLAVAVEAAAAAAAAAASKPHPSPRQQTQEPARCIVVMSPRRDPGRRKQQPLPDCVPTRKPKSRATEPRRKHGASKKDAEKDRRRKRDGEPREEEEAYRSLLEAAKRLTEKHSAR